MSYASDWTVASALPEWDRLIPAGVPFPGVQPDDQTAVLVRSADGTGPKALADALRGAVGRHLTVQVGGQEAFKAARGRPFG